MPLGDSITHGYPSPSGYRNYLWYQLQDKYDIDFVGTQNDGYNVTPHFDFNHEGYGYFKTYDIAEIIYSLLEDNQADIILLHIGSNDASPTQGLNSSSVVGLEDILQQIDHYERDYNHPIKVILASIINRREYHSTVTYFNKNLRNMANMRISNGDNIVLVDMEYGAGLVASDFADATHPNDHGYTKMANVWYNELINTPELSLIKSPNTLLVENFIKRFYVEILKREADQDGLNYWVHALVTQVATGADIAHGFIFSQEFLNQNVDDSTYLTILYHSFFDRAPDNDGFNYWLSELEQGKSRYSILTCFLYSLEFNHVCNTYNIIPVK